MRELIYVLSNGTELKSYQAAKASGFPYKADLRVVKPKKSEVSPISKAMLEQFGYVSPNLKDKVLL